MSLIFVNGKQQSSLSVLDRGVLYGDSLFETIAVQASKPLLLEQHLQRLKQGAKSLKFNIDFKTLEEELELFLAQTAKQDPQVLRVTLTRGVGGRGYKPLPATNATRILSLHDWPTRPESVKVSLSQVRYSHQPKLAGLKHGNRLEQVLASMDIPEHYDDVIMLDQHDNLISASKGNLFLKIDNIWVTPKLNNCGISGIIKDQVIQAMTSSGIRCQEKTLPLNEINLNDIQAAFICNSIAGILSISHFLGEVMPKTNENTELIAKLVKNQAIIA